MNDIVFKTHQRANLIFRCFVSHNTHLLLRAFVMYVRPLLEYNCIIHSSFITPIKAANIHKLHKQNNTQTDKET